MSEKRSFFIGLFLLSKKKNNNKNERPKEGIKKGGGITQMGDRVCVGNVGCVQTTGSTSSSSSSSSSSSTTKSFDKEIKKNVNQKLFS